MTVLLKSIFPSPAKKDSFKYNTVNLIRSTVVSCIAAATTYPLEVYGLRCFVKKDNSLLV